jgi:hypothetical protein
MLDIDLIVRAHEAVKDGHAFNGERNQLCTIFSAPNYCGLDGNSASVMKVSEKLEISFVTLKPRLDIASLTAEQKAELAKIAATHEVKSPSRHNHLTHLPHWLKHKQSQRVHQQLRTVRAFPNLLRWHQLKTPNLTLCPCVVSSKSACRSVSSLRVFNLLQH